MTEAASVLPDDDTYRMAGITDSAWWSWFEEDVGYHSCDDPWRDWLKALRFPHEGPLRDWLEYDIESAIRAADELRLTSLPQTETFTKRWATFRSHHEELDGRGKYCRNRYMIWRAAALTAICERNCFQDDTDAHEAHDKLAKTMRWFWPTVSENGNYPGGNFWRPTLYDCSDGSQRPGAMAEYAAMVLLLMRHVLKRRAPA